MGRSDYLTLWRRAVADRGFQAQLLRHPVDTIRAGGYALTRAEERRLLVLLRE